MKLIVVNNWSASLDFFFFAHWIAWLDRWGRDRCLDHPWFSRGKKNRWMNEWMTPPPKPMMGHDYEHQRHPQFKQVCSWNNHFSVHLFPFLFTAPPSALGIMSKSYWALTLGCCLNIQTLLSCCRHAHTRERFFTDGLLIGPSHACVCMIEGLTM